MSRAGPFLVSAAVPTEVVLTLIEGVGGQWHRGTSGQGAKGTPVAVEVVVADLRRYELHEVTFYEI